MKRQTDRRNVGNRNLTVAIVLGGALILCVCVAVALIFFPANRTTTPGANTPQADNRNPTLVIAHSPEKAALFKALTDGFNSKRQRTPDGQAMEIRLLELTPEEMVNRALTGETGFQAITPDSSLWLDQLNRRWAQSQPATGESGAGAIARTLTGEPVRYAISPIVIAAWEDTARSLGWPGQPVGWSALQSRGQSDANFRWSHPSTAYASGLLATLAEFYAGAGVQRGLTAELAQDKKTVDYVAAIEKTIKYYGEAELAVMQRVSQDRKALDAFVVSEQLVIAFNTGKFGKQADKLVALYPAEGTFWADHPLALLETPALTDNQRRTFQAFREYLSTAETQQQVLAAGYRPADLGLSLTGQGSPFSTANGVDPKQPQTTLQLPTADVVQVVQNVWALTKRKTNVFLVVDTSGSMQGAKLDSAKAALKTFLAQIPSDQEKVGLVEFNTGVTNIIELDPLADNRGTLNETVDGLRANGNTALLDAVRTAYTRLQQNGDPERINAIVAMTDGRENASMISLRQLVDEIRAGNQKLPVVIFCIAYGRDADYNVLQSIADASGGQVREGNEETIRELYKILSSYF